MSDQPTVPESDQGETKSDTREELRTISFRLREIQRLLSVRVQQENRRLEAEGITPVSEATFFKHLGGQTPLTGEKTRSIVETLAQLTTFEDVKVTLDDGMTLKGRANPITYSPNDRLRLEIHPRDVPDIRYELRAEYSNGEWTIPVVRRYITGEDDWTKIGQIKSIQSS